MPHAGLLRIHFLLIFIKEILTLERRRSIQINDSSLAAKQLCMLPKQRNSSPVEPDKESSQSSSENAQYPPVHSQDHMLSLGTYTSPC